MKSRSSLLLSRRPLLAGAAATFAIGGRAQAAPQREIRFATTTALQEMSCFAIPDYLGSQYTAKFLDFGASGTSMLAAMMNRLCDAMSTANSYLVSARAEGAKLVAVAGVAGKGQAIAARTDKNITRLEDLRGKKLVTRTMTSSHVMMQIALRAVGVNPKTDVTITDIGQPAGFTLMVDGGGYDGGQIWEPFASMAAARPNIRKLELDRFFDLTWHTHSSLLVTQTLIDEEPNVVRDLVEANIKAVAAFKTDRAKFLDVATRHVGQTPAILNAAIDNCDPRVEMDATMFYRMAEEMYGLGMVRKNVTQDIAPYINYKFLSDLTGRSAEDLGYVSYDDYKSGKRWVAR